MPKKVPIWWVDSPDIKYAGTVAQALVLAETEMQRSLLVSSDLDIDLDDEFASDMRWVARSRYLAESHLHGRGFPLFLYAGELDMTKVICTDKTGWQLVLVRGGGPKGTLIGYSDDYPYEMMSALCQSLVAELQTKAI